MSRKIIFLDIDGVLNDSGSTSREPKGARGIDDDKCELLADIVRKTGADIVLTSTWRMFWDRNMDDDWFYSTGVYLNRKLRRHGVKPIDKTPFYGEQRGKEITKWLEKHPVDQYVVLDDEKFGDFSKFNILPHLVMTDELDGGLKQEHVEKAIQILGGEA